MFEPVTPENKLYPTDSKEMVGKEEWVAEKAMEVRSDFELLFDALEWDGERTGSEDVYRALSVWMTMHQYYDAGGRANASENMRVVLQELAERYAEYVLLPAHIEKMKNGDFAG